MRRRKRQPSLRRSVPSATSVAERDCPRCHGWVIVEFWRVESGPCGYDWRCVLCGWRQLIRDEDGYTPVRPVGAKGVPERSTGVWEMD